MSNLVTRLLPLCALQLVIISFSNAQNKPGPNTLQHPPANVTIDGDLKEWGDSLRYYNDDKKIYYTLANDTGNLYMAIRINDRSEQVRILRAGLTLSIDTKGKKKETFSVTFPVADKDDKLTQAEMANLDTNALAQNDKEEQMRAQLTKLRQIKVTGFKDVESDVITTSNTYGFKNAIDFDKDGNLVYEASIPLRFFHAEDITKTEWAFNFKINGISRPSQNNSQDTDNEGLTRGGRSGGMGGGGGRGGHGGGRGGQHSNGGGTTDHSELSKSVDFWEKFFLAK